MKSMFLLSHTPIPRFIKKINIASEVSQTKLLYWDRKLKNDVKFTVGSGVVCESIELKAPIGKTLKRSLTLIIFLFKSLKIIKKYGPNNLHVGNLDMLLIAFIYKTLFNKDVKIIYEIGDLPEIIFKSNIFGRLYKNLEKALMKKVDFLILSSSFFWEVYYKQFTDYEKYIYIPNVPSISMAKTPFKKRINQEFNNENLTIGFIGSIRYEQQLKMLFDEVMYNGKINLLVAGTGMKVKELKKYTSKSKNIKFTGPYDYKEIGYLYSNVDIIYSVYDTDKENVKIALPNRLYESLLFEKPLIVSKNTELANFVLEHNIGFEVSDKSPEDLRKILTSILRDEKLLKEKQKHCNAIKKNYTYEAYIPKIKALYR